MNQIATSFYQSKKEQFQSDVATVIYKIKLSGWFRLIAFVMIFIPLIIWGFNGWFTVAPAFVFLIIFSFLVKWNINLEQRKKKLQALLALSENELLALTHQFSHFDCGKDFLDPAHFNSYDLDLFGEGSVFQFINRTSTQSGRQKLADWLKNPLLEKDEIEQQQEAVKELSAIPDWRLHFLATGILFRENDEMNKEIKKWSDQSLTINHPKRILLLLNILPVLTILAAIFALAGSSSLPFVITVFTQWGILYSYRKKVAEYNTLFGRKSELLGKYMQMLEFIETHPFHAPFLVNLRNKVMMPEKASQIFRQLKHRVNQLEYRDNLVVNLVLNSIFLWDVRSIYKLWNWHFRHRKKISRWLDVLAETDALLSLANLAFNHPEFVYPEVHEGGYILKANHIGHPLIQKNKRVNNILEINGWGKIIIITGANMAGKSTFLRTVGVNLLLARMGAPVCAESLRFSPVNIYTNMRTTDSLLKDESYFFAELKRIKTLLDKLENGERMLVILDEMLKGTNSVDKLNGSRELIRKLLDLKAVALIATHDLKISEMEDEYPQMVFNKCFEIKLEGDEMKFDYLLQDGVTKTMNATFLMKKMGII
jgi:ABC-type multidrug transport system fused ATPase/permease subunit